MHMPHSRAQDVCRVSRESEPREQPTTAGEPVCALALMGTGTTRSYRWVANPPVADSEGEWAQALSRPAHRPLYGILRRHCRLQLETFRAARRRL